MSDYICFLITFYLKHSDILMKVALRTRQEQLPDDLMEYPLESTNRAVLHGLLPEHLQGEGIVIVEVEEIFDICLAEACDG